MTLPALSFRAWAEVALSAIVVVFGIAVYEQAIATGAWRERSREASEALSATAKQRDSALALRRVADTIYVQSVRTFHERDTVYRTLRDTLNVHDTIQVVRVIEAADSLEKACRLVQTTCDLRHRADSIVAFTWQATAAGWQGKYDAAIAERPGIVARIGRLALAGAVGFAVGRLAK